MKPLQPGLNTVSAVGVPADSPCALRHELKRVASMLTALSADTAFKKQYCTTEPVVSTIDNNQVQHVTEIDRLLQFVCIQVKCLEKINFGEQKGYDEAADSRNHDNPRFDDTTPTASKDLKEKYESQIETLSKELEEVRERSRASEEKLGLIFPVLLKIELLDMKL
ncbi:hypothetical protein HPB51_015673 [Rhipicephalus microplus]|uniref:Uncharacterized protein n=1 Tax=Rhipicephalus microplus TaxID=6941 RepID=A0A9J6D597_RHIMP|nr:hypothetical protein HPB51_015673 [Rhipicephalus microplus]